MSTNGRVLFLVDADNVSVDVVREALQLKIEAHGAVHLRRCYCSADFYGLPRNAGRLTLRRRDWTVPASLPFAEAELKPLRASETMHWAIE